MLMRREVVEKVGSLDEAFGIGGYDDTDYSMRAHIAGYKSVAIKNAYVHHRLHASFDKAGNREEWVKRNRAIYYRKWGKHLRMAVVVSMKRFDHATLSRMVDLAYGLAREWTWVHLFINGSIEPEKMEGHFNDVVKEKGLPLHQNIRVKAMRLLPALFYFTIAGKLIERLRARMRDKRFDAAVLVDNAASPVISVSAKVAGSSVVRISSTANIADWQKKGKEIALYIKNKKKEYE